MEAMKGRYLRPEHDPDDDLRAIGVNITDRTKDIPADAPEEIRREYEKYMNELQQYILAGEKIPR